MKPKINPFWGILSLLLAVLTLVLCVFGARTGVLYVKTDADPAVTARVFFDAVREGNTDVMKACMENYSSLGLENSPGTEAGRLEWDALLESYSFELLGPAEVTRDTAVQTVQVRYLDLTALEFALSLPRNEAEEAEETDEADEADSDDEADAEAAAEQAREEALARLRELLEHPEDYYTTTELPVTLHYADGRWLVQVDDALLRALSGGKA